MGHTHYHKFVRTPDAATFAAFAKDARKIIEATDIPLADLLGEEGQPEITSNRVSFNGLGEDSYESFFMDSSETGFSFCKTNKKPYDEVVVAVLIAAKHHFGDNLELSTDASAEEAADGLRLAKSVLGYGDFPCIP